MSELEKSYNEGYHQACIDLAKPEEKTLTMDAVDIMNELRLGSVKHGQSVLRSIREEYGGGKLGSSSLVLRSEFDAWCKTPHEEKVRI